MEREEEKDEKKFFRRLTRRSFCVRVLANRAQRSVEEGRKLWCAGLLRRKGVASEGAEVSIAEEKGREGGLRGGVEGAG